MDADIEEHHIGKTKKTEIYEPKRRKFEHELKIKQVDQGNNLGGVKMEKSGKIVDAVIVLEMKTDKLLIVDLFSTNAKTSDWMEQIKRRRNIRNRNQH